MTRTRFSVIVGLMALLYIAVLGQDITRPYYGLHSWARAHKAWLARAHVNYGLGYTKGLLTWAVGNPPAKDPSRYLDHPQLTTLLNAGAMMVFGVNDWALRLMALIVTVLSLPILMGLLGRLFGEATAVIAPLLYLLFPVTGYFFDFFSWLLPFVLVAWWCYLALIGYVPGGFAHRQRYLLVLAMALVVMVQLHWEGLFYAAGIGTHYVLWCVSRRRGPDVPLLVLLVAAPFASLGLNFLVLLAARGWDAEAMIAIYQWRSSIGTGSQRNLVTWFLNLRDMALASFTLPVLIAVASFLAFGAVSTLRTRESRLMSVFALKTTTVLWLSLAPGILFAMVFSEALWVHHYQFKHFSFFMAIAAALGLLRLHQGLMKWSQLIAHLVVLAFVVTALGFGTIGLNAYREFEYQPPSKLDMFRMLNKRMRPNEALLSYVSHVVMGHPAKGAFYRPEVAWYLDRRIVMAKTLSDVERYAATGRFPFYLMPENAAPFFEEMKKRYRYESVQGRPTILPKIQGMPTQFIFDLRSRSPGS